MKTRRVVLQRACIVAFAYVIMLSLLLQNVFAATISGGDYSFDYTSNYTASPHKIYDGDPAGIGNNGTATVTETDSGFDYTVGSAIHTKWSNRAGSGTGELTITNNTGTAKKVSLQWSLSYDTDLTYYNSGLPTATVTFDGTAVQPGVPFSSNLGNGDSIVIKVVALGTAYNDTASRTATVSVTDFSIEDAESVTVDIGAVTGATTTAVSGSTTKTVSSNDQQFVFYEAGSTILLSCDVASGYTMQGWMVGNSFVSGTADYTYTVGNNSAVIYPVVLPDSYSGDIFEVNSVLYDTWDSAMAAAGSNGMVILRKDYSLPATMAAQALPACGGTYVKYAKDQDGNDITSKLVYTIPSGVTVLVPYDDTADVGYTEPQWSDDINDCSFRTGGTDCTTANKTLTVPTNTTLVDNGTLIVNAQVSGQANKNEGTVFGTYGKMVVAGNVTVNGTLYARGYIVDSNHTTHTDGNGTGLITISPTGSVYMPLQILDYRGGNASSSVYGWIFPITQYKFQNIMVRAKYEYGAALYGQYFTSVNNNNWFLSTLANAQMTIGTQQLFGSLANCYIQLTEGNIYTDYDYNADQLIISVDGTVAFNDLTVKITVNSSTIDVTTANKEIPFPYGMAVKVLNGAVINLDKKIKMLPGSWVEIQEGGTINLSGSVYLYDDADYQNTWSYGMEAGQLNVPGIVKSSGVTTWNNDAVVHVKGTLNITGTVVQSASHSGGIIGYDGAEINATSEFAKTASINEMAGANTDKVPSAFSSLTGLLAGLSTSATDFRPFSTPGTGTYYATDKWLSNTNAAWYQYVVTVDDGAKGVTAVNDNGSVGETDGYVTITHTVGETIVTHANVVGYAVNGGSFSFNVTNSVCSVNATTGEITGGAPYTLTGITANSTLSLIAHTYVNCVCSNAGCKWFKFYASNVRLGNNLNMMFAFPAAGLPEDPTNYYVVVTHTKADGTVKTETIKYSEDAWLKSTVNNINCYYITYTGIAAKEMSDEISVTVYDTSDAAVCEAWADSIREYAHRLYDLDTTGDTLKTVIVDMLNYGAACQVQFKYNTGNPANANLTEDQKIVDVNAIDWTENLPSGSTAYPANLVTESNIRFAIGNVSKDITYTFTNHWGTEKKDLYLVYQESVGDDPGYYYINTLVVADARCVIKFSNGVEDSIEAYCKRMIDAGNDTNGVFTAFMKFSQSARIYLHDKYGVSTSAEGGN